MINKLAILVPDGMYHVYNRANGSERLFRNEDNYQHFLKKYKEYISPIAETFCYCLLPNHFHFLIRIRDEAPLIAHMEAFANRQRAAKKNAATQTGLKTLSELRDLQHLPPALREKKISKWLSEHFSHLCNSYTQAINKRYKRKGGLFMRPFKRILVNDDTYRYNLIKYIHQNPLEAQLCENLHTWLYSSYSSIVEKDDKFVNATELLAWFDGVENFIEAQKGNSDFNPWDDI